MTERDRRRLVALVRAATSTGAAAVDAWDRRPADFDLDEVWDRELGRLLPFVGHALVGAGYDGPDLPRLRGMQRKCWVEHQLQSAQLAPAVATLSRVGIDAWVCGGGLLARATWAHGGAPGTRWADDTRLLVRREDAERAHGALIAAGAAGRPVGRVRRRVRLHGGVPVRIDDRWTELRWLPTDAMPADTEWWSDSGTLDLGGVPVRELDPAAAAVTTCLAVAKEGAGPSVAVDVCRLLTAPEIGRDAVAEAAGRARATKALATATALVERVLDHSDDGWVEHFESAWIARRPVRAWRVASSRLGTAGVVVALPELLAERWHLDRVGQIPAAFAQRVVVRTRRAARGGGE